jgi:SNF2 family DNA or RNA helicase
MINIEIRRVEDLHVITTPEHLNTFKPLEVKQLDGLPSYSYFLQRTQQGFNSFREKNPNTDERPYQYEYAAIMCTRRHNIMGWDMGVGKTIATILTIYGLYKEKLQLLRPGCIQIVVLNLLAAERWLEDFSKFKEFEGLYTVTEKEKQLLETTCPIIIYSQDFPKRSCKTNFKGKKVSKRLANLKPLMLVVDEVHGLRSSTSRTKHLTLIRNKSRRCLALTGTPSEGNLKELHNILTFVYGENWVYASAQSFSKDYGVQQKIGANYLYGASNVGGGPEKYLQRLDPVRMPSYYRLMRRYMHRVRIDEPQIVSCMKLPTAKYEMHEIIPSREQKDAYIRYINEHKEQLKRVSEGVSQQHTAEALQLINPLIEIANYASETNLYSPKLNKLVEIVEHAEGKVVIFCDRVASAWLCKQALASRLKLKVIRLYSKDSREEETDMGLEKRIEAVTQFQYDPNVKAGVFSINLAGQSIDLTKASDVIYYCLPWSSIKIQQSISRVVRSGNPYDTVKLHYLYQQGLVDEYQTRLAIEKIRCAKLMLDYEIDFESEATPSDLSPSEAIHLMFT